MFLSNITARLIYIYSFATQTLHSRGAKSYDFFGCPAAMSKWLKCWTWNPMGSPHWVLNQVSNPACSGPNRIQNGGTQHSVHPQLWENNQTDSSPCCHPACATDPCMPGGSMWLHDLVLSGQEHMWSPPFLQCKEHCDSMHQIYSLMFNLNKPCHHCICEKHLKKP